MHGDCAEGELQQNLHYPDVTAGGTRTLKTKHAPVARNDNNERTYDGERQKEAQRTGDRSWGGHCCNRLDSDP